MKNHSEDDQHNHLIQQVLIPPDHICFSGQSLEWLYLDDVTRKNDPCVSALRRLHTHTSQYSYCAQESKIWCSFAKLGST